MMKTRKGHNVYPITVAQKFHLYYAKYCPNMAVLNLNECGVMFGNLSV